MKKSLNFRVFLASSMGNTLEFYDFSTYGLMMSVMAPLFFPAKDPMNSLLIACAVFAISFIVRPLGGIFFGYIGDKYGGKNSFSLSLILMALSTSAIGFLPVYEDVGILSPILLIVCRLIQGLCIGGEFSGSLIYASEHFDKSNTKPAFITGCITAAGVSGWFLSSLVCYLSLEIALPFSSWRLPFLLGSIVGFIGYYVRRSLPNASISPHQKLKITLSLKKETPTILSVAGIGAVMGGLFYGFHIFPNTYLPTHFQSISQSQALQYTCFGIGVYMVFLPISGWISDKVGHLKFMKFFSVLTFILASLIFSLILSESPKLILLAEFLASIILAGYMAPATYVMTQSFASGIRYRLASFSYNLGASVIGGLTPSILLILSTHSESNYLPGLFISSCGVIGIFSSSYLRKKLHSQIN